MLGSLNEQETDYKLTSPAAGIMRDVAATAWHKAFRGPSLRLSAHFLWRWVDLWALDFAQRFGLMNHYATPVSVSFSMF